MLCKRIIMNTRIKKTIKNLLKVDEIRRYRRRMHIERELKEKQLQYENKDAHFHVDREEPLVSIIITTQKSDDLAHNLQNMQGYGQYEVIECETVGNRVQCKNEAVCRASGEYLLFLDGNMQLTAGWLDELMKVMYDRENVGVVGSRIVYSSKAGDKAYRLYHAGMILHNQKQGKQYWIKPIRITAEHTAAITCACAIVTGECMLVRRSAFEQVGGFETLYENGYEDQDLCLKLIHAGYHNYYCGDSLVLYDGISAENMEEAKKKEAYNREIFKGRWQRYLLQHILEDNNKGNAIAIDPFTNREQLTEIYGNGGELQEKEIDICGAMPEDETRKFWGDYHYAMAMKREFEKLGYRVNVRSKEHWYDLSTAKYVIVLRGVKAYYPGIAIGQRYIMWNISHPAETDIQEYDLYDYVFFASQIMQDQFGDKIRPHSGVLMQCTDPQIMHCTEEVQHEYELLFVGNSRRVYRQILKDLIPTTHHLTVYGRHWEEFPVQDYVVADYIANEEVGQAYHDAKILLNDHWDDMREYGIISNRIFDALAVGAFVISDEVPGMEEIFSGAVVTYNGKDDLASKIDYYLAHEDERKEKARIGKAIVLQEHTFRQRVWQIAKVMEQLG